MDFGMISEIIKNVGVNIIVDINAAFVGLSYISERMEVSKTEALIIVILVPTRFDVKNLSGFLKILISTFAEALPFSSRILIFNLLEDKSPVSLPEKKPAARIKTMIKMI